MMRIETESVIAVTCKPSVRWQVDWRGGRRAKPHAFPGTCCFDGWSDALTYPFDGASSCNQGKGLQFGFEGGVPRCPIIRILDRDFRVLIPKRIGMKIREEELERISKLAHIITALRLLDFPFCGA